MLLVSMPLLFARTTYPREFLLNTVRSSESAHAKAKITSHSEQYLDEYVYLSVHMTEPGMARVKSAIRISAFMEW